MFIYLCFFILSQLISEIEETKEEKIVYYTELPYQFNLPYLVHPNYKLQKGDVLKIILYGVYNKVIERVINEKGEIWIIASAMKEPKIIPQYIPPEYKIRKGDRLCIRFSGSFYGLDTVVVSEKGKIWVVGTQTEGSPYLTQEPHITLTKIKTPNLGDYHVEGKTLKEIEEIINNDLKKLYPGTKAEVNIACIVGPNLGFYHVEGKTLKEIEEIINNDLKKLYPGTKAEVYLKAFGKIEVHVLGRVKKPGKYYLLTNSHLSDALEKAGVEIKKVKKIILKRNKNNHVFHIKDYYIKGDITQNPYLKNGDVIIVK
jgi:protein involved in polysaccharide export with SLBB domain